MVKSSLMPSSLSSPVHTMSFQITCAMTCYHSVVTSEHSSRENTKSQEREKNNFHVAQHKTFTEKLE
jgi:hypothetical protein